MAYETLLTELSDGIFGLEPRKDIIQRCVQWQLNKRQAGTHKAKGRAEIWRTGKKMYKQKGTGGARHGSARVPQFRGGGRAFGPVVRSHATDLPKKVRALALRHALSAKAKDGGILVIDGDASLRCGISLKGADIVVGGSVGSFSAFMAQAGRMVICGDAEDALGDSLYEAVIYVRGRVRSLGADARFEPMSDTDRAAVKHLLSQAGVSHDPAEFKRVASAKSLYHWHADADQEY